MDAAYAAREARRRPIVLRTKIFRVRSVHPEIPILVLEGKTDVAPYEVWQDKLLPKLECEFIPGDGKDQLLEFVEECRASNQESLAKIYFIIDRDFDGLRSVREGTDVFCTPSYSFENELVSDRVLESILRDEIGLGDDPSLRRDVLILYRKVFQQCLSEMFSINLRLAAAAFGSSRITRKSERISDYLSISIEGVERRFDDHMIKNLIVVDSEPQIDDWEKAKEYLADEKELARRSRGKYLLEFFKSWVQLLFEQRSKGEAPFQKAYRVRGDKGQLTVRNLASRSDPPEGLAEFLERVQPRLGWREKLTYLARKFWKPREIRDMREIRDRPRF